MLNLEKRVAQGQCQQVDEFNRCLKCQTNHLLCKVHIALVRDVPPGQMVSVRVATGAVDVGVGAVRVQRQDGHVDEVRDVSGRVHYALAFGRQVRFEFLANP